MVQEAEEQILGALRAVWTKLFLGNEPQIYEFKHFPSVFKDYYSHSPSSEDSSSDEPQARSSSSDEGYSSWESGKGEKWVRFY